jgi:hypothetical protein
VAVDYGEGDMSVRDDLIAARALIDTPEKMAAVGSVLRAIELACDSFTETGAAFSAVLEQPGNGVPASDGGSYYVTTHADILDRIDRAIEAAK